MMKLILNINGREIVAGGNGVALTVFCDGSSCVLSLCGTTMDVDGYSTQKTWVDGMHIGQEDMISIKAGDEADVESSSEVYY